MTRARELVELDLVFHVNGTLDAEARAEVEALLAEAFDQIRGSAEGNVAIIARMLGAIDTLSSLTVTLSHRRALDEQVQWIAELADRTLPAPQDRARIERRLDHVREALRGTPVACAVADEA